MYLFIEMNENTEKKEKLQLFSILSDFLLIEFL